MLNLPLIEPIEPAWTVASVGVAYEADDQRFVMVRTAGLAGGTSRAHVVIIDNWFEELREKMRTGG